MRLRRLTMVLASALALGACELASLVDPGYTDDDTSGSSGSSATGSYDYSFSCPAGGTYSVPIPNRLSSSCRSAWEYYARTYGCNDADNFAEANSRKAACP